ncbi:hypothetical protein [uncultured Corynebacterium sp.]|uniref:hypothetical protein n=1 Tax=uncultured Corynebacterium sp. TaxID=159447 RepID=UPI0025E47B09|nr:hypothetical protein [uncultured Corynebacterium sp.]
MKERPMKDRPMKDRPVKEMSDGGDVAVEKHWGDPDRSQPREDFDRGEMITAIVWLSVAALVSLILEVAFLGTRVTIGGASIPAPWTIVVAYVFNLIITRTAMLWTKSRNIALIPTWTWIAGFVLLFVWTGLPFGGDQVHGEWLRTIVLLVAGIVGGGWPVRRRK